MKQVTVRAFRGMIKHEEKYDKNEGRNNFTYGEATSIGQQQILSYIKKDIPSLNGKFLDIGSGYGKLVTFIAEQTNMYSIGVEINEEMYDIAEKICWTHKRDKIHFINDDIRNLPALIKDADIIYINCVTWNPKLVSAIFEQAEGIIYHNHIRALKLSNGKMWDYPGEPAPIHCSWGEENQQYYRLKASTFKND
tara:strand:+ start:152 stop:733 length:582 start_codon:yes stop_codon:yes gene_type:complete